MNIDEEVHRGYTVWQARVMVTVRMTAASIPEGDVMGRRFYSNRNDSGSLLASLLILVMGLGSCFFAVAAMAPNSVPIAAGVLGSVFVLFLCGIIMQRFGKAPSMGLGFLSRAGKSRRDDGAGDYMPRKAGESRKMATGTNQPITAGEAHELRITSASTWVPAKGRKDPR